MQLAGETNVSEIARRVDQVNADGRPMTEKVKRAIRRVRRTKAALDSEEGLEDAQQDYIEGKHLDLADADSLFRNAESDAVRLGALKSRSDFRDNIAAALGVVTERKALDVKQDVSIDFGISEDGIPGQAPD
jgi:glutathione S-transferase